MRQSVKFLAFFLHFIFFSHSLANAAPSASRFVMAVVSIQSQIIADGRTVETLGQERRGSGVVIDSSGLVVTVGYLVLEAREIKVTFNNGSQSTATVVANDYATGLALLRTTLPQGIEAMPIGDSRITGIDEDVVVLKHSGIDSAHVASIADIREFSGSWEYHIERAFFTTPSTRNFSGAALLDRDARLVGIGSLLLSDIYAGQRGGSVSGNLFIPIEHLNARMGGLLAGLTPENKRPWLGLSLNQNQPDMKIVRVAAGSPADIAGIQANDALLAIDDTRVTTMRAFYQALWSAGESGIVVDLLVVRNNKLLALRVKSIDREQWLRN